MKYGSKQHKLLKVMLTLNPKLTVKQASHRLHLMVQYIEHSKKDSQC